MELAQEELVEQIDEDYFYEETVKIIFEPRKHKEYDVEMGNKLPPYHKKRAQHMPYILKNIQCPYCLHGSKPVKDEEYEKLMEGIVKRRK